MQIEGWIEDIKEKESCLGSTLVELVIRNERTRTVEVPVRDELLESLEPGKKVVVNGTEHETCPSPNGPGGNSIGFASWSSVKLTD